MPRLLKLSSITKRVAGRLMGDEPPSIASEALIKVKAYELPYTDPSERLLPISGVYELPENLWEARMRATVALNNVNLAIECYLSRSCQVRREDRDE